MKDGSSIGKNKQLTFSHLVKDELSGLPYKVSCCRQVEICAAFFCAGRFYRGTLTLSTAHIGYAQRLTEQIRQQYQAEINWQTGRELISLIVDQPGLYQTICLDIQQLFGFAPLTEKQKVDRWAFLPDCCHQAILRALFLACGSISEPSAAYHLELSLRQAGAAEMVKELLESYSIHTGQLKRHGYTVIYMKEGQFIADFLLLTGAHQALLNFESLRVDKEMRNTVNRVVNCDSANTQRMANTAARQLDLIRRIIEKHSISLLPADLQAAAQIRLENPDLSLRELGELMQPPLGKSGMNHRLQRLEQVAAELLMKARDNNHGT